jgi:hypothetical protein
MALEIISWIQKNNNGYCNEKHFGQQIGCFRLQECFKDF